MTSSSRLINRRRYYIAFSTRNAEVVETPSGRRFKRFRKAVWPILFDTEIAAFLFASTRDMFQNAAAIPGVRGHLISFTIEPVGGRRPAALPEGATHG